MQAQRSDRVSGATERVSEWESEREREYSKHYRQEREVGKQTGTVLQADRERRGERTLVLYFRQTDRQTDRQSESQEVLYFRERERETEGSRG